jgi:ribosome-associated translation inhibitor RaiA
MSDVPIQVQCHGSAPRRLSNYAREKVAAALGRTARPVLRAQVWLDRSSDPAVPEPAVAKVEIVLNGDVVRAHAVASTVTEAIDLMQDRLRSRMARVGSTKDLRGPAAGPNALLASHTRD